MIDSTRLTAAEADVLDAALTDYIARQQTRKAVSRSDDIKHDAQWRMHVAQDLRHQTDHPR